MSLTITFKVFVVCFAEHFEEQFEALFTESSIFRAVVMVLLRILH